MQVLSDKVETDQRMTHLLSTPVQEVEEAGMEEVLDLLLKVEHKDTVQEVQDSYGQVAMLLQGTY